ncbi:MAG: YidC/Oxa1 family membrane protein insertase [Quadrisphaera sp.]
MPSSWSLLNPLAWLESAVSGVLVAAHALLGALGLDPASGGAWVGAVVVLVVVVRLALLPLLLRQVRASHRLARIAPQLRALQGRYSRPARPGGRAQLTRDPAELARWRAEQKALHAEAGASPLSLLPVLLQLPVMIALARVLDGAARGHAVGLLTPLLAVQAGAATVLGAPLSGSLVGGGRRRGGGAGGGAGRRRRGGHLGHHPPAAHPGHRPRGARGAGRTGPADDGVAGAAGHGRDQRRRAAEAARVLGQLRRVVARAGAGAAAVAPDAGHARRGGAGSGGSPPVGRTRR